MAYGYLHIGFFLTLGMLSAERERTKRFIYLSVILALILAIFFTFSRGWVSLLVGLGVFLYLMKHNKSYRFVSFILFFMSLAMFIFVQLFFTYTTDLSFSFSSGYDESRRVNHSAQAKNRLFKDDYFFKSGRPYNRMEISAIFLPGDYWYRRKIAAKLWQRYPLLGVGPGMFGAWITKLKESNTVYIPKNFPEFDPHSTYFGALAEGGLLGLITLFILYFCFLKRTVGAFKRLKESYFKNLILCCISAFVGLMVFAIDVDIMDFRWVWFLLGLSVAIIKIAEQNLKQDVEIDNQYPVS
jgi:O-antigen ligase